MSSLLDAWDAYCTALSAIPGVHVSAHGGEFTREELARYGKKAPALVVALLRFDTIMEGGSPMAKAYWGTVAFTRSTGGVDGERPRSILSLCEQAVPILLNTFAGTSTRSTSRGQVESRNLFGTTIDRQGIAMWGMEWTQILELQTVDSSVTWEIFDAKWDLSPRANDAPLGQVIEAEDIVHPQG